MDAAMQPTFLVSHFDFQDYKPSYLFLFQILYCENNIMNLWTYMYIYI